MNSSSEERSQLNASISALESQRPILGDSVVEPALAALREKLAALEAQDQPAQQRKLATVLFADVSGFTALSETMDAEVVAGIMNDLWALVDQAITGHGGRIDKHIGDAVMALWVAEAAREDDPEMAVRAGLAIQAAVDSFRIAVPGTGAGVPKYLTMRIGNNTGPVMFGRVGHTSEFTAMGDVVNLASRLEQITYFKGRVTPAQQRQPYSLFRDLLSYRFDVQENDEQAVALEKLRNGMGIILEQDQVDVTGHWLGFDFSVSPAVSRLLGSGDFGALGQAYLLRYLRRLAEDGPVYLLLEDIHWADESSLNLISHLVAHLTTTPKALPFLIVCVARPEFLERRPHWGEGQAAFSRIDLKPLSQRAGRELVAEILQKVAEIPAELQGLIISSAEGNPFYVEELIKMFIDEGVIIRGEELWQIASDRVKSVHVPPTLTGLLQARLDALPLPQRDLLQRASVIGRQFWDSAVAGLSERDRTAIMPDLGAIRERELIYLRERSTFSGSDEYVFKHALLRDVAYETVLLKLRRDYHARIARWLEENAGARLNELLGLIAEHYAAAGENTRAADLWERKGDQALLAGSAVAAREAYERVLQLSGRDEVAIDATLALKLGKALLRAGHFNDAERYFELARRGAKDTNNAAIEVEALDFLGWSAIRQGDFNTAKAWIEYAAPLAETLGGDMLARVRISQAYLHWQAEELNTATALAEEGLAHARAAGDTSTIINALNALGALAVDRGDLAAAETSFEETRRLAAGLGDRLQENVAILNLGNVHYERGQFAQAKACYRAALEGQRELGSRGEFADLSNLAFAELALGEIEDAWRHTCESIIGARRLSMIPIVIYGIVLAAKLYAAQGQLERALALFGLVRHHPSTGFDARRDVDVALAELGMSQYEIEAGLSKGLNLDLETVVQEILDEKRSGRF